MNVESKPTSYMEGGIIFVWKHIHLKKNTKAICVFGNFGGGQLFWMFFFESIWLWWYYELLIYNDKSKTYIILYTYTQYTQVCFTNVLSNILHAQILWHHRCRQATSTTTLEPFGRCPNDRWALSPCVAAQRPQCHQRVDTMWWGRAGVWGGVGPSGMHIFVPTWR